MTRESNAACVYLAEYLKIETESGVRLLMVLFLLTGTLVFLLAHTAANIPLSLRDVVFIVRRLT